MERPVAIVREAEGLYRVVVCQQGEWSLRYDVGAGVPGLDAAYQRLANFRAGSDADLQALTRVLEESLPSPRDLARAPTPRAPRPLVVPRATAAHPRAYRGTKRKPPTPETRSHDVRPWLADPRALLAAVPEVAARVEALLAARHPGIPSRVDLRSLGSTFLPSLAALEGVAWPSLLTLATLHRQLVAADPALLPLLTALSLDLDASTLASLFRAALAADTESRRVVLEACLEATRPTCWGAPTSQSGAGFEAAIARVLAAVPLCDPQVASEMGSGAHPTVGGQQAALVTFFSGVREGASCAHAAGAIEIQALCSRFYRDRFGPVHALEQDVAEWVFSLADAFRVADRPPLSALYEICALLPEARGHVERLAQATHLSREARGRWVGLFAGLGGTERGRRAWQASQPQLLSLLHDALTSGDPDYGDSLSHHTADLAGLLPWDARARGLSDTDVAVVRLASKHPARVLWALRALAQGLGRAPALSPSELHRFAKGVPQGRNETRLDDGLRSLAQTWPEVIEGLSATHPAALVRVAIRLGLLLPARARELLVGVSQGPLFDPPESMLSGQLSELQAHPRNPMPRALRRHLAGDETLRPDQLRRHTARTHARWDLFRLDLAEAALDTLLAAPVGGILPDSEGIQLALTAHLRHGTNRRAFRKMWLRWLHGERDAVFEHPSSLAWIRRHPRLDVERWKRGIELTLKTVAHGEVTLRVERDPFEALRLGVVGDTCLAPGGLCEEDAAGVVLDVNKRVVYARDAEGRFVGRQLVAISERDELIGYPVYPSSAEENLGEAFERFDRELAASLRVPLKSDRDYQVACVLSRHLWDDGLWERLLAPDLDIEADTVRERDSAS